MTIRFICEKCGKKLKAQDDQAGVRFQCSGCGEFAVIPGAKAAPLDEEEVEPPIVFERAMKQDEGLDMTPMVDVTFLLLIFFMITAAFSLQKSQHAPPPELEDAVAQERTLEQLEEDDDFIIVTIDEDSIIWVDDQEAPTRQAVVRHIREVISQAGSPPTKLLVNAHVDARFEQKVTVIDVGYQLGLAIFEGQRAEL